MAENKYFEALGLDDTATIYQVKEAYAALASNGEHPDHGGDIERWKLITAAFNELKAMFAKKRGGWGRPGDLAWLRSWTEVNAPKPERKQTPKGQGYAATHATGTVSDPSRRCGRETKSGPCCRAFNHPHGCMSQAVKERKIANSKAKAAAAKAAKAEQAEAE